MKKKKSRLKSENPQSKLKRFLKSNRQLFKIYLVFGLVLLGLFTIIMIKPVYFNVVMPFNEFLARSSASVLNLFGGSVTCSGSSVSSNQFSINIAEGCNGIYALAIVIAGIAAFPAAWRPKSLGLIMAVVFIMILNYIRILTLWYTGLAGSFIFDAMHLYVWEFIIIVLGAAFWYYWYEKFVKTRPDSR